MSTKLSLHDLALLLVEPSRTQGRIIAEQLREVGLHKIEIAHTGGEALELMLHHVPDLVASAMYFDDMTGAELVETMRSRDQLADVPFMLVSSERHVRELEPVRQAGVLAILPKPFRLEDLKRALYASLDFINAEELELDDLEPQDLRVLIVDDSRMSMRYITQVFSNLGVEHIVQAANGREAAERIRDERFDLVVSDYNMPEMDGEQLVHYIRQLSDQQELPVLMVTGEQDESRLASVRQAGVSALLDKPFDLATARELIRRVLSR